MMCAAVSETTLMTVSICKQPYWKKDRAQMLLGPQTYESDGPHAHVCLYIHPLFTDEYRRHARAGGVSAFSGSVLIRQVKCLTL